MKISPLLFEKTCYNIISRPSPGKAIYGPIAQLGERTVRIRKVVGSIPIRSTKMEIAAVKNCGDFSFNYKNITDGFLF